MARIRPGIFPIVCLSLTFAASTTNAAEESSGNTQGKIELQLPDGCVIELTKGGKPGAVLEQRVATDNPLVDMAVNETRAIALHNYSTIPRKNREAQDEAAQKLAEKMAEVILSEENLQSEEGLIRVQDILSTTLGRLPDGALSQIDSILEADLGSLRDPSRQPEYKVNTNNALAELTRVVTEYRKEGLDLNSIANAANKLSRLPVIGRFFDNTGNLLRERFQSVKGAIKAIDSTLEGSVAHMRMRHEQMKAARLELRVLERYLEVARNVAEQILAIARSHAETSGFDQSTQASFDKNIIQPLVMRIQMINREQAAVVTAYHQFRLLMDGNLDLIVVISNIRETSQLELSVFGAGKIIANEQQHTMDLAKGTLTAVDELRNKTIEQIRQQGIELRAFPDKLIQSTEAMTGAIDSLLAEMQVAQENVTITIDKLEKSNAVMKQKLEEAAQKSGSVNLIELSDKINDEYGRRDLKALNQLPPL